MSKLVPIEDLTPAMRAMVTPGSPAFNAYATEFEKQYKLPSGTLSSAQFKTDGDPFQLLTAAAMDAAKNPATAPPVKRSPGPADRAVDRNDAERQRIMDSYLEEMGPMGRFAAGMGQNANSVIQGVKQLTGLTSQKDVDETSRRDAPLLNTTGGFGGSVVGGALTSLLPAGALMKGSRVLSGLAPNLVGRAAPLVQRAADIIRNPYAQAAGVGGIYGSAMQPVESGGSRAAQGGLGALAGAGGQAVGSAVQGLIRPVAEGVSSTVGRLADKAESMGIPIRAADISNNKVLQSVQHVLDYVPFSGAGAAKDASQQSYNRALARQLGEDTDDFSKALVQSRNRNSQTYNDLAARNTAELDPVAHGDKLLRAWRAFRRTDTSQDKQVSATLDDYLSNIAAPGNATMNPQTGKLELTGAQYQKFRSEAGQLARDNAKRAPDLARFYNTVKETLDDAMRKSSRISPEDRAAYAKADKEWANMRTLENLAPKDASGNVDFNRLASVLSGKQASNIYNRDAMVYGQHSQELPDLARIGTQFLGRGSEPGNLRPWMMRGLKTLPGAVGLPAAAAGLYKTNMDHEHGGTETAAELGGLLLAGRLAGKTLGSRWYAQGAPKLAREAEGALGQMGAYRLPLGVSQSLMRRAPPEDVEDIDYRE